MNECALIFDRAGIDTNEVIDAAATKWNFHPYRPGLVGGHCISVDPYYLTHFAERLEYRPEVIQAGRRVNDSMGTFVAQKLVRELASAGRRVADARVGVLGLTFKEDVVDLRNTRVVELVAELRSFNVHPLLHDPLADPSKVVQAFTSALVRLDELRDLDAAVIAVPHQTYRQMDAEALLAMFAEPSDAILLDVRGVVTEADRARFRYWCL
jgi:UDP-N-acetyl-D-galactosamine dehydrogenase